MTTYDVDTAEQVDRANGTTKTPVVFVHGLWLLPSSWDRWAAYFEEAGYAPVIVDWPDGRSPARRRRSTAWIRATSSSGWHGLVSQSSAPPRSARTRSATGAGPLTTFFRVRLPAALPQLFVGIKSAAVNATVGACVSEWVGGDAGLGYYIQIASGDMRMDIGFAVIFVLAAVGLFLFGLVVLAERWLIPWHVSQRVSAHIHGG